ncbi:SCO4225 family membrane protein [Streptomyces sp. NPDC056144]|uniref:SCO4225 family membrane protein n=1 Tax=unclassified Streptomyces TaxID=2593676 RepID=UPI0035E0DC30
MRDSRFRTFVQLTFANPASLAYLALVLVAASPLAYGAAGGDPGFAAVWLLLATAPTSMGLLALFVNVDSALGPTYFLLALAAAALLHSFLLGLAYRAFRKRMPRRANALA